MAKITITNVYCQLDELDDKKTIDRIDKILSYYVSGYQYAYAYKRGNWDGKAHLLSRSLKFQTGLLPYVEEILKKANVEYNIKDIRKEPILGLPIPLLESYYKPRDYQIEAVELAKQHKVGIIKSATGSGKTLIITKLCGDLNIKTIVYVISLDLLYQTKKGIEDGLGTEIGIIGDGNCDIKRINVATPWTIIRSFDKDYEPFDDEERVIKEKLAEDQKTQIRRVVEEAEMFIYDEAQFLGGNVSQFIAKMSKNARYKIAMSGTPWRTGDDSILLEASTGKQLIDIDATSLIEQGILVKPKIFFFDVPNIDELDKMHSPLYNNVYEKYIVENDARNSMIIESIKKLRSRDRKVLLLIRRKKHGLKLLEMMPKNIKAYFLNGDAQAEERQAVKDLMSIGGLDVIIATSIFDQGVDIKELDALILGGSGKSTNRALQRIGRVIRGNEGKKDAIIVDFIDNAPYLYQHSKKRFQTYSIEKGFEIKLPNGIIL